MAGRPLDVVILDDVFCDEEVRDAAARKNAAACRELDRSIA
jgi:hypothetical protein